MFDIKELKRDNAPYVELGIFMHILLIFAYHSVKAFRGRNVEVSVFVVWVFPVKIG